MAGTGEASPLLGKSPRGLRRQPTVRKSAPAEMQATTIVQDSMSSMQLSGLLFLQDAKNVEDNYPKLNADSLARAASDLAKYAGIALETAASEDPDEFSIGIMEDDTFRPTLTRSVTGVEQLTGQKTISLRDTYDETVMFKNRAMKATTLLHFAIWFASEFGSEAELVEMLLSHMEDPDDVFMPAYYAAGATKVVYISAVHLAAGLGQVEILKLLTTYATKKIGHAMTSDAYVSQWAQACPVGTSVEQFKDPERSKSFVNQYQPIHDATFAGFGEVTLFLLKHKADPVSRNNNQITPLHFVAFVGIRGGLEDTVGQDLKKIVNALQRTGKATGAKASMHNFIAGARNVTPLEVAVEDGSRFPQDHLGLLAPCLADNVQELTYFDDIKRIADVTPEGALKLVDAIADKGREQLHVLRRFRLNAQMQGKSDVLASILFTAPLAARAMLELLEVSPEVEDAAHHPIPPKTSLWGLFQNVAMRCAYKTDVTKKQALMIPYWEYLDVDAAHSAREGKVRKANNDGPHWHERFMPRPRRQTRATHVKNVNVVASLLPNILDIDVFMALSCCQLESLHIMNQKTVQGMVYCLWNNLVQQIWMLQAFFRLLDVWAYVILSGTVRSGYHFGNAVQWPIIAAGNLQSIAFMCTHLFCLFRKWSLNEDDATMHDMWSPGSRWNLLHTSIMAGQTLLGTILVVDLAMKSDFEGKPSGFDDALLATCLLISCLRFIWMWRLSVVGSRIYTIAQTFSAAAVNQMLFIVVMLLFSFIVALQVLSRLHSLRLAVDAYRGFMFGDGDGFNGLGMNIDHDYEVSFQSNGTLLAFSVFGSFFFNVIILNIIIAIYGNEYDRVEHDTPKLFMQGRADFCTKTMLSCYIIPWKGKQVNRCLTGSAVAMLFCGLYIARFSQYSSALLIGAAQVLLPMAFVQCSWFSPEGADAQDRARYLWICHPHDWQWVSDDAAWEEELAEKQESVDNRLEAMDEKVSDMQEKLDQLLMMGKAQAER